MALGDIIVSKNYLDEFKEDCQKNIHRTTLGYFGLDLIIDKKGEIHCLEINGQHSGTSGLIEIYGKDTARENVIKHLTSFGLPLTIYTHFCNHDDDDWAKEQLGVTVNDIEETKLNCSKKAMGNAEMSDKEYVQRRASMRRKELEELNVRFREILHESTGIRSWIGYMPKNNYDVRNFEGVIWNNTGGDYLFDGNRFLVVNPRSIELVTNHKYLSYLLLHECFLPSSLFEKFSADKLADVKEFLKGIKSPKVVFKPDDGKCGDGVVVLDKRKLVDSSGKLKKNLEKMIEEPENHFDDSGIIKNINWLKTKRGVVVQPFVESKPFYNTKTRKHHRGVIRYAITVHSHDGVLDINHEGAYAKLTPEPVDNSTRNSFVASLSEGAHPAPISSKDFNRLKKWVDHYFITFYRRALRMGEKGHYDPINEEVFIHNYTFLDWFSQVYNEPWRWY